MQIIVHRGNHEIGGTCVEVKSKDGRVILDLGLPLSPPLEGRLLPRVSGLYNFEETAGVNGVLISHSHMDHCGMIEHIHPDVSCHMGAATRQLIDINSRFRRTALSFLNIRHFKHAETFSCGGFQITPYLVDHSSFDAYAFLIECKGKKVFYSGDFRSHGRKAKMFSRFIREIPEGIDALLLEGTVIGRPDHPNKTEEEIQKEIADIIVQASGAVFGCCSGQNIDRLVTFFKAARASRRTLVIDPYIAIILDALKHYAKLPHCGAGYNLRILNSHRIISWLSTFGFTKELGPLRKWMITTKEILKEPRDYLVMVRGSTAEELRPLYEQRDGSFIYSMWKGYKETKAISNLLELVSQYGFKSYSIHTSGHADVETLRELVEATKPRIIVPIHTERPDLYSGLFPNYVISSSETTTINV